MTAASGVPPGPARRAVDLTLASVALVVLAVPLCLMWTVVRLTSRGPGFYRQIRLGQGGRPFTLYKLRTMRAHAAGSELTAADDPRVTRVGRLLRAASLDELPQLWNIVRGDMTLVGPRPETPGLAALYPAECRWVFAHRPGLTGPAQVRLRDGAALGGAVGDGRAGPPGYPELVARRVAEDAGYLRAPDLRSTFRVLAETVRHLLGRPIPPAAVTTRRVAPGPAGIGPAVIAPAPAAGPPPTARTAR